MTRSSDPIWRVVPVTTFYGAAKALNDLEAQGFEVKWPPLQLGESVGLAAKKVRPSQAEIEAVAAEMFLRHGNDLLAIIGDNLDRTVATLEGTLRKLGEPT